MEPREIASLIMSVNDNATNTLIQQIRRRLSILERPFTTARGDGKSYIYSNFNPKYAQMAMTILRTYYNFFSELVQERTQKRLLSGLVSLKSDIR